MTYKVNHEFFEEGQVLFKAGDDIKKLYILADGHIETYL